MNKDTFTFALLFSFLIFSCAKNTNTIPSNNDIYTKVDSLMSLMTIKEKLVKQLCTAEIGMLQDHL